MIRTGANPLLKLELAIIENIQREDLNPIDRARAFDRLASEFKYSHDQIGKKVGKSRVYVTNTLRLLRLPEEMVRSIAEGKVSEGHARALGMLSDRPGQPVTLYKAVIYKKITVRDAERIARSIAIDRVRRPESAPKPEVVEIENKLSEFLGTRVCVKETREGGQITIDYFSSDDLSSLLERLSVGEKRSPSELMEKFIESSQAQSADEEISPVSPIFPDGEINNFEKSSEDEIAELQKAKKEEEKDELYDLRDFSV